MTTIYLIRHGQTVNNERSLWGGDSLLTADGIDDAIGIKNKNLQIDALFVSNKESTKQTADYAFPEMNYISSGDFDEIYFGVFEDTRYELKDNIDKDEVRKTFYKDLYNFHKISRGESATSKAIRFILALDEIAKKYDGKKVAVISSETIILASLAYLYRGNVNYKSDLELDTGEILELECEDDAIVLKGPLLDTFKNMVI